VDLGVREALNSAGARFGARMAWDIRNGASLDDWHIPCEQFTVFFEEVTAGSDVIEQRGGLAVDIFSERKDFAARLGLV
jgi:hypothetical protein